MTSRDRVIKTLTFATPDRAPRDIWALPAVLLFQREAFDALLEKYPMDIGKPQLNPGSSEHVILNTGKIGSYTDDWGSVWHLAETGVVGEVKGPALAEWSALADYQPPWRLIRNRNFDSVNRMCDESDRFMLSEVTARPFERMQFLRGSEPLFMDIAYGTGEFYQLLEMIHDFYLQDIEGWCQTDVDGIFLMDDWGAGNSLLISPDTWRTIYKPLYKAYCDRIHDAGKYVFFHTDGFTEPIYGDLIEVGVDAINSQLFTMDIERLAQNYKGKVTFWGEMDRQHVLPFGTTDEVREAVMRVRVALDDGTGGVIAQCEWGKHNPTPNIDAVYDAWLQAPGARP